MHKKILGNSFSVIVFICIILHIAMGYMSYQMSVIGKNTDYWMYYTLLKDEVNFGIGRDFFVLFHMLPDRILESGFLFYSMFYTILTAIPFCYFFYVFKGHFLNGDVFDVATLLMLCFLPSVHFWLASFSKDALCFFLLFVLTIIYSSGQIQRKTILALVVWLLISSIRPYLGIIVLLVFLLLDMRKISWQVMLILVGSILTSLYLFIRFFLKFEELNIEYISDKFIELGEYAKKGNSIIDLETTSVISRFFYMMFRPFIYETKDIHQFIVGMENLLLLVWFIWLIVKEKINLFKIKNNNALWCIGIALGLWLFYSLYIYNYGLASRMKATILPFLFYGVLLWRMNKKAQGI